MEVDEGSDQISDTWHHWMAAHAYLKNEFTEDKKGPKSHELAQITSELTFIEDPTHGHDRLGEWTFSQNLFSEKFLFKGKSHNWNGKVGIFFKVMKMVLKHPCRTFVLKYMVSK